MHVPPQLLAKEGSKANLKELVATKLVRARPVDDSKTTKLAKRLVGEAVDYWFEGGWWTVSKLLGCVVQGFRGNRVVGGLQI